MVESDKYPKTFERDTRPRPTTGRGPGRPGGGGHGARAAALLEELERAAVEILAPYAGYVIGSRAIVPTRPGDVLITFGRLVSEQDIMAGTV